MKLASQPFKPNFSKQYVMDKPQSIQAAPSPVEQFAVLQ
jgi:hypothetical protein